MRLSLLSAPLFLALISARLSMHVYLLCAVMQLKMQCNPFLVLQVLLPNDSVSPSTLGSAVNDDKGLHDGDAVTDVGVQSRPLKTSPDSSFATEVRGTLWVSTACML